jgi:two-component system phosphate regulon sensor histidine kinase PhoR
MAPPPAPIQDSPGTQLLAAIVESSGDALYSVDRRGRLLTWNRGAQDLYGYSAAEAVGRPLSLLWPRADKARLRRAFVQALDGRPHRGARETRRAKGGAVLTVSAAFFPIRGARGEVRGVAVCSRDVSAETRGERAAAEAARLRESERLQREFVANVSHELRTPVAAIRGFAETLRLGASEDPKTRTAFLKIIEKHAIRLSGLIEDLLSLTAIESGRRPLRRKAVALEPLIRGVVAGLGPLLREKEIQVALELQPGLVAFADEDQLVQVLQNLLSNAIRYSARGGSARVSAEKLGRQAIVSVADKGRGIPAADLPTIFQRFNRPQRMTRGKEGGTGLGLSIAKELIEAHGGRIWAESALRRGSTFRFTVPLRRP